MAFNTTKVWKTAAYIRLSREDVATKNGERAESESVVNQQQIISDFITSQPDLGDHLIFIDDGATGTNFDRTGFQSMMQEIHAGNINCVVVKDLSRFGRNYTEAGVYMEQVFPMLGVRFIAINDHVDSFLRPAEMDSILIPLKNLLNDSYSRDLSIKVRSAMTAKRKRGEFIGGYACYGYAGVIIGIKPAKLDKHWIYADFIPAVKPISHPIFSKEVIKRAPFDAQN